MNARNLDKVFDDGEEDILEHFDLTRMQKPNLELRRINVDFPAWVVNGLDHEAQRLGITRQSLIKMWIAEKLDAAKAR